MNEARIGIIGAGYWATYFYLPSLRTHPQARCVGVVRRNRSALDALRRGFDLEVATTEVDELLALECDGVVVASPHQWHRRHAEQALNAGCHVLVEKPMALRLTEAQSMASAAVRAGRVLTVAHGWNYSRMATWAMDLISSGRLGKVHAVVGYMASALIGLYSGAGGYGKVQIEGFEFEASAETYAVPGRGGGYLYGQMSHLIGLVLAVIQSEPLEVFAQLRRLPSGADIDAFVSVKFSDGVQGTFSGTGRLPWGVRYPLDVRIIGEAGVINLDFDKDSAEAYFHHESDRKLFPLEDGKESFIGRRPDERLKPRAGDGIYSCEGPIQFLIDRCTGRDVPDRAPFEMGRRCVAILEAAGRSSRLQRTVKVSEL